MQSLAISTCWNSGRHQDGEAMLCELRELGFTVAELGHGIRYSLWPGVLRAVEAGIIQIRTTHNFCPVPVGILTPSPDCYEFTDPSVRIRELAVRSTLETLDQSALLGVKAVVLHLGSGGPPGMGRRLEHLYRRGRLLNRHYVNLKLKAVAQRQQDFTILWDRVKGCLDRIVPHADSLGIKLGAECRSAYEEWPDEREMETVLQAYAGTGLGYWHDFGHAARKEFLGFHTHAQTLAKRASRLWGCHVHDGRPPSADHLALGDGEIDFAALVPLLPTSAMPVLELHPRVRAEQVIESRTRWEQWVKGNVCVSV